MRRIEQKERTAIKWAALMFVLFWIGILAFRILTMATQAKAEGYFT
ncbi:hypothetical protein [Sphingomonas sp. Leaf23]|nr:hypothetical protein [Sphingomonas sp. Leaf23]